MDLIHRQRNDSSTQVGLHYCTLQGKLYWRMSTILIDLVSEEINCYPCLNHALSADMIDKRKQSNFSYAPLKRQRWRHLNVFAAYELVSNTFLTCSIQLYRMNSSLPKSRTDYVLTDTSLIGLHTYRGKLYSTSRAINLTSLLLRSDYTLECCRPSRIEQWRDAFKQMLLYMIEEQRAFCWQSLLLMILRCWTHSRSSLCIPINVGCFCDWGRHYYLRGTWWLHPQLSLRYPGFVMRTHKLSSLLGKRPMQKNFVPVILLLNEAWMFHNGCCTRNTFSHLVFIFSTAQLMQKLTRYLVVGCWVPLTPMNSWKLLDPANLI